MNKKKVITMLSAVALVAVVGVGATLAYFTDSESTSNVVTMGHVDITLYETDYTGDEARITEDGLTFENVMPGDVLDKDPSVKLNAGSADAYVRVKMDIVPTEDSTITEDDLYELREAIKADVAESGSWYYNPEGEYFYYKDVLTTDSNTAVLFDTVEIPVTWGNNTADQTFTIELRAEAIQENHFKPIVDEQTKLITSWGTELLYDAVDSYEAPVED